MGNYKKISFVNFSITRLAREKKAARLVMKIGIELEYGF